MHSPKIFTINLWLLSAGSVASAQAPLTPKQVLEQVRTNNPVLRVERLNVSAAQADQITANLRTNPVLNNQTLFQQSQPGVSSEQAASALTYSGPWPPSSLAV